MTRCQVRMFLCRRCRWHLPPSQCPKQLISIVLPPLSGHEGSHLRQTKRTSAFTVHERIRPLFRSKWMSPTTIQHRRMIINSESQPLLIKIGAAIVSMRCNCGDRGRLLQRPDQADVLMRRKKTAWIMRMVTIPALDHVYTSQVHITRKKGDCETQGGNAKNRLFICSHTHTCTSPSHL